MKKRIIKILLSGVLFLLVVFYVGFHVFLGINQESIIYPGKKKFAGQILDEEQLKTNRYRLWKNKKEKYIGLFSPASEEGKDADMVWLIFYGNGDSAQSRMVYEKLIRENISPQTADIYIMEYPGYGPRVGTPSEKSIIKAAIEALDKIKTKENKVYLMGQSMGTGVVCGLVEKRGEKIEGVLLLNPYDTLAKASKQFLRNVIGPGADLFFPQILLRDKYHSIENMKRYTGPVGIVAGEKDSITTAEMGKRLYEEIEGKKRFLLQKGVGHTVDWNRKQEMREMFEHVISNE